MKPENTAFVLSFLSDGLVRNEGEEVEIRFSSPEMIPASQFLRLCSSNSSVDPVREPGGQHLR